MHTWIGIMVLSTTAKIYKSEAIFIVAKPFLGDV